MAYNRASLICAFKMFREISLIMRISKKAIKHVLRCTIEFLRILKLHLFRSDFPNQMTQDFRLQLFLLCSLQ